MLGENINGISQISRCMSLTGDSKTDKVLGCVEK